MSLSNIKHIFICHIIMQNSTVYLLFLYSFSSFYKIYTAIKLGSAAIPQIPISFVLSLLAILTYPFSPHVALQEFLTFQYLIPLSTPYPTISTAWSKFVPHDTSVKIPVEYDWKYRVSASIATTTGFFATALFNET